jgi:hypothetical protein
MTGAQGRMLRFEPVHIDPVQRLRVDEPAQHEESELS